MVSSRNILVIGIFLIVGSQSLHAAEAEWKFIKEQKGIRLYRRDVPGTKIDEFKGEAVIHARIDVIGMALRDVPAYPS